MKGKVTLIGVPQEGVSKAGKPYKKEMFVVKTDETYPQVAAFTVFNGKCNMPKVGDVVDVSYNVNSRGYNGNYYTELMAWSVKILGAIEANAQPQPQGKPDDLPF
jgi:hypothetical protein